MTDPEDEPERDGDREDRGVSLGDGRAVGPSDADDQENSDGGSERAAGDEPLADLRRDVEERRSRDADESDGFDGLFTDVDVGTIDDEQVWEDLAEGSDGPLFTSAGSDAGREVSVVQKRLCHRCPHFADPPELSCNHDGTDIDAEVDTEHFRVLDCPMVDRPEHAGAAGFSGDST